MHINLQELLIEKIGSAVANSGYNFYSGPEHLAIEQTMKFPAVWLSPPKLIKTQGKAEIRKTYHFTLYMMSDYFNDRIKTTMHMEDECHSILLKVLDQKHVRQMVLNKVELSPKLTPNSGETIKCDIEAELIYNLKGRDTYADR